MAYLVSISLIYTENRTFLRHTERHSIRDYVTPAQADVDRYIQAMGRQFFLSRFLAVNGWRLDGESLLSCRFRNWTCSARDFTPVSTEMGTCYR